MGLKTPKLMFLAKRGVICYLKHIITHYYVTMYYNVVGLSLTEKTRITGEPQSCAGQRLRRGQSCEKAAVARHVRPARTTDVQHRSVTIPDGVQVGIGPTVRRWTADSVGRRSHRKVEVKTQDEQQQ